MAMTTYQMLEKYINMKKRDGVLNDLTKETLKFKLDVYMLANRISESQYNLLMKLVE